MIQISLPEKTILTIEEAPHCLRMYPAADGARIELTVSVSANQAAGPVAQLTATLSAQPSGTTNKLEMCTVTGVNLVQPNVRASQLLFVGNVSMGVLRAVEEHRQSRPMSLVLDVRAQVVAGEPPELTNNVGHGLTLGPLTDDWITQLQRVTAASHVEILVPVTDDPELVVASGRVLKARALIRNDEMEAAAVELRQVLDAVRAFYKTKDVYSQAAPKKAGDRTKNERWAVRVQDTFNWLSTFVHDDEEAIKGETMDRAEALDALATVAGFLYRLAVDKRAAAI